MNALHVQVPPLARNVSANGVRGDRNASSVPTVCRISSTGFGLSRPVAGLAGQVDGDRLAAEEQGFERAEELKTNLEKWLPDTPDREKWNMADIPPEAEKPLRCPSCPTSWKTSWAT